MQVIAFDNRWCWNRGLHKLVTYSMFETFYYFLPVIYTRCAANFFTNFLWDYELHIMLFLVTFGTEECVLIKSPTKDYSTSIKILLCRFR